MKKIPATLSHRYTMLLNETEIPDRYHHHYLKWLRNYLDFCHKYQADDSTTCSLPHFIEKLKEKRQTEASQRQANSALLYANPITTLQAPLQSICNHGIL